MAVPTDFGPVWIDIPRHEDRSKLASYYAHVRQLGEKGETQWTRQPGWSIHTAEGNVALSTDVQILNDQFLAGEMSFESIYFDEENE
jgi:hypothetical protein